ncbi:cell division protein FtsL [Lipingzhangella halophila]|uniref:Cell division protein FtsL n=1 Tax=Lipingzhangella halophila TaxID=1783352 RepID=A0A7W7RD43_9ACTN|nr:septum formation initiator family protein [Lipingzhangella halophila]MBB4929739.1 cell division protein FtsL [Lipingzhangella halophila]
MVCAIALSLAYPLREYVLQRAEIAKLQEERERTEQSVSELEQRHEELQDPDHIEREARERLHYQYPDERAYVIIADDGGEEAEEESAESREPWFTRLWKSVQEADQAGEQEEEIPEAQPPGQ